MKIRDEHGESNILNLRTFQITIFFNKS